MSSAELLARTAAAVLLLLACAASVAARPGTRTADAATASSQARQRPRRHLELEHKNLTLYHMNEARPAPNPRFGLATRPLNAEGQSRVTLSLR